MANSLQHRSLMRYMTLSVAAAVVTIVLKSAAAWKTGSVGFLSDAVESVVNLIAALNGLLALRAAARPPDDVHHFGHGNAEYLSAAIEGTMILVAALVIIATSIRRLIHPSHIEGLGVGLALSTVAAAVNLVVGLVLIRVGREHRSMTLQADGQHLLTDVWTTAGVLIGMVVVAIFHWQMLDPLIALVVGLNIIRVGYGLLRRSASGLLDAALPLDDAAKVAGVIDRYGHEQPVEFHALRTQESGRQRFVYVDVQVPGEWTVERAHDLVEQFETDLAAVLPGVIAFTHLEPVAVAQRSLDEGAPDTVRGEQWS